MDGGAIFAAIYILCKPNVRPSVSLLHFARLDNDRRP